MTKTVGNASTMLRSLCSRPLVRLLALGLALIGYAYVSLEPFEWSPPRLVDNGAAWSGRSSLSFPTEGLVVTPGPPDWLPAAARHHALEISLRVWSGTAEQWGHILTIGAHGRQQNLAVSQRNRHLRVQLRRTCHHIEPLQVSCTTSRTIRRVVEPGQWMDLAIIVRPGGLQVAVDGEVVLERALSQTPLAVWEVGQPLALGNDVRGGWPWLGEIERAVVRVPGLQVNLLDPDLYNVPMTYWAFDRDPRLVPFRDAPLKDMVRNLVMYAPFGMLVALLGFAPRWSGVARVFLITGAISLTMETAQLFFSAREPSITDLLLNATGGAFGFALIQAIRTDPRIPRALARINRPRFRAGEQEG